MFKVFEIMAAKGMGTIYSKRQTVEEQLSNVRTKIFGYNIEGIHVEGKKDTVAQMFDQLKDIPFSDPNRETFKKNTLREKRYLDKMFNELKKLTSQLNEMGRDCEE